MESGGFVYSIKLNKSPAEDKHNCKATSGPAGICQHYTAAQSKIKHFLHLIYMPYALYCRYLHADPFEGIAIIQRIITVGVNPPIPAPAKDVGGRR